MTAASAPASWSRGPLLVAGAHVVAFMATAFLFPGPRPRVAGVPLATFWLVPPALLAILGARRRAYSALGAGRISWGFLSTASALRAVALVIFVWDAVTSQSPLNRVLSLTAHHAAFGLLVVALLLRRPAPRPPLDARDGLLLATLLAFFPAYAVLLFPFASPPMLLIRAMEDIIPALLALRLALGAPRPWTTGNVQLAVALGAGAVLSIPARASYFAGVSTSLEPIDVGWILPLWGVVLAASVRTTESWLTAAPPRPAASRGPRFVAAAVAVPALLDLAARALRLPGDAEARTFLALATSAALALFAGLRLRRSSRERALPPPPEDKTEGSPELMRLASGTAHELNNPFMAVALAAELAVARGGAEAPLRALQQSVHEAAAAVRRFQILAASRVPGQSARGDPARGSRAGT